MGNLYSVPNTGTEIETEEVRVRCGILQIGRYNCWNYLWELSAADDICVYNPVYFASL